MGQQDGFEDEGTDEMLLWLKVENTLHENDDDPILYDNSDSPTDLNLYKDKRIMI